MNVPLGNLITLPLSEFMFVVRNLWLEERFSNDFEYAQEKIEKLVDILDLGGEATIIDFAQHKLEVKKLEEQKINIEKGKQNGVMTFREVKLFNHSELSRLQMIHMLVKNFNDNNHIQMAEYEKKIALLKNSRDDLNAQMNNEFQKLETKIKQNKTTMAEYEKEIARLETEIEKLQLIVLLYQDESEDEDTKYHTVDTDPDDNWKYDNELGDMLAVDDEKLKKQKSIYVVKRMSPYIGVASTQNPYCITIATKEMDRLLGTKENFIQFAKKRCAIAAD